MTNFSKGAEQGGHLDIAFWDYKLIQSLWKTMWKFFKQPKIEIPYDSEIPLLCIYSK